MIVVPSLSGARAYIPTMQPPCSGWLIDTFTLSHSPRRRMPMQERMHPNAPECNLAIDVAYQCKNARVDVNRLVSRLLRHAGPRVAFRGSRAVCLLRSFIL